MLGENGPYAGVRSVHLHHKLAAWVRMLKDEGMSEQYLQLLEDYVSTGRPIKKGNRGGMFSERSRYSAVVTDDSLVKFGKLQETL